MRLQSSRLPTSASATSRRSGSRCERAARHSRQACVHVVNTASSSESSSNSSSSSSNISGYVGSNISDDISSDISGAVVNNISGGDISSSNSNGIGYGTTFSTWDASSSSPLSSFSSSNSGGSGGSGSGDSNALLETKFELLKKVAGLNRGALATANDKYEIESMVELLESSGQDGARPEVDLNQLTGKWELLYSSVEAFRSSPFFLAFQEGLVQDRSIASEIFKFTDSIPGAEIGAAYQTIAFDSDYSFSGTLVSEVDMTVFPGIKGAVVTTCNISKAPPRNLSVTVLSTKVANSPFSAVLDQVSVPVKELIEGVRGPGATTVDLEIAFLDSDLRIGRSKPDNQLFIYRRLY